MRMLSDITRAILIFLAIIYLIGKGRGRPSDTPYDPSPDVPQLHTEPYHCEKDDDMIRCEGRVTNISAQSLKYVVASVECFEKNGGFVTSDWGAIEYQPILPGQTSPYLVLIRYSPAIRDCAVSFRYISGGSISSTGPDSPKHRT